MAQEKGIFSGGTTMLVLNLLEHRDMYGYEMIEELGRRSEDAFRLKTGTLYPLLHGLEQDGMLNAYEQQTEEGRMRKYYSLTEKGGKFLAKQKEEWKSYTKAVNRVMKGGTIHVFSG